VQSVQVEPILRSELNAAIPSARQWPRDLWHHMATPLTAISTPWVHLSSTANLLKSGNSRKSCDVEGCSGLLYSAPQLIRPSKVSGGNTDFQRLFFVEASAGSGWDLMSLASSSPLIYLLQNWSDWPAVVNGSRRLVVHELWRKKDEEQYREICALIPCAPVLYPAVLPQLLIANRVDFSRAIPELYVADSIQAIRIQTSSMISLLQAWYSFDLRRWVEEGADSRGSADLFQLAIDSENSPTHCVQIIPCDHVRYDFLIRVWVTKKLIDTVLSLSA
jgi:hypothetical protein